ALRFLQCLPLLPSPTLFPYTTLFRSKRVQWITFVLAGVFAGLAGALFVFSKGSAAPEVISISKSVDALVMVLLGGVQTLIGPVRSEEHTSELQSRENLVCRLLLEKKK